MTRIIALVVTALLATIGLGAIAPHADAVQTYSSLLIFDEDDPTLDPGGSGTELIGAVTVTANGRLDFSGRSVVETPTRANLNPGTGDFSFGASVALTRGLTDSNIMQKGFFNGSQYKMSLHRNGGDPRISCRVSGATGALHVYSPPGVVDDDATWHRLRCQRSGSTVSVWVDDVAVAAQTGPIGSVANPDPYRIGSKGITQTADPDQYLGLLDDAFVALGTPEQQPPPTPNPSAGNAYAEVETDPVLNDGDAADDPAIWVHPTAPERSLVIGNDKGGALESYGMDGRRVQRISEGFFGNVDVRQQVALGPSVRDIAAVYRSGLRLYAIDQTTRLLSNVTDDADGSIPVPSGGEGLCMYRSALTQQVFAFVISRGGNVAQYRLADADGDTLVDAQLVRSWSMGSETESCVADDELGHLYLSEEDVALWKYGAEPTAGTGTGSRTAVDRVTTSGGRLRADIEGLSIVRQSDGRGYLVASAQAGSDVDNFYAVYERQGANSFVRSFKVETGPDTDGCGRTDGIETVATPLGPQYPYGLFVCQDNLNTLPATSGNQNFKLVPLERVVQLEGAPPLGNIPPTARIAAPQCDALVCSFDGTASTDPDGDIASFAWDFDGTGSAPGAIASHTFPATGTYAVSLTVTDDRGASDVEVVIVDVGASTGVIGFRAATSASRNGTSVAVTVPAPVVPGDLLLLLVSANRSTVAISNPLGSTAWTPLTTVIDDSMQTRGWWKVADDDDVTVSVSVPSTTKLDAQLLAYSGTHPTSPVAGHTAAAEAGSGSSHTTPTLPSMPSGGWLVSYWADKSNSTSDWTAPAGTTTRVESIGTSTGRVTSLSADSGGPATGAAGGLTAVASSASDKATSWSIAVRPGTSEPPPPPVDDPPTARIAAPGCVELTCAFDGSGSDDPDDGIASFAWEFGGTGSATTAQPSHVFPAPGRYTVTLTVTDVGGLTDSDSVVVDVDDQATSIAFRGASSASRNATSVTVQVPPGAQQGDALILLVTSNRSPVVMSSPSGDSGWQPLQTVVDGSMETRGWWNIADADDASVTVTVDATTKLDAQLLAYSGTDPVAPVAAIAAAAETGSTATHVAPGLAAQPTGSWVLRYWADKTASSTGWAAPAGLVVRQQSVGTGSGRIASLSADSGTPVSGAVPTQAAVASTTSDKATSWTIALRPG